MKNSEQKKWANFFAWLAFVFFTVLLPITGGWLGWRYIAAVRLEARLHLCQVEANDRFERLQLAAESGHYACRRIDEVFEASQTPEELRKNIDFLNQDMALGLKYLIWDAKGSIFHSTFDHDSLGADWKQAFKSFLEFARYQKPMPARETANLRRIYGPQFFPETFSECYSGRHVEPLLGDSSNDGRLSWIKIKKKQFGLSAFFSRKALEGMPGIEHQIREMTRNSQVRIATIKSGQFKARQGLELKEAEIRKICESSESPVKIDDWYVYKGLIRPDLEGLYLFPAASIEKIALTTAHAAMLLAFFLLAVFVTRRSYTAFCLGRSARLSIRKQLIILFVLSNVLSLSILAILGFDYLREYELLLQARTFSSGMTYLQSIDEMHVSELSSQLRRLGKGIAKLKEELRRGPPAAMMLAEFLITQQPYPFRLIVVGSHTPFIGSEYGIMKDGEFVHILNPAAGGDKQMKVLVDAMGKLGRYYLSMLNRETLNEMIVTQVELIAESLGQLRSIEMFQEFFAATGMFWQWGMGWRYYPAYIDVFYLFEPSKADYVFLYLWEPRTLEHEYISRMYNDLNRNPIGLKIMAVNEDFRFSFPGELLQHDQLLAYTTRLREKTGTEIDFCDWQGQKHLLMGLKCSTLAGMRLLGLYPVDSIETQVRSKFWLFFALGLVSMLVSLALSLVVSRSILNPLSELQTGVLALQKQDFAHRLPDLGGDEFGHLAQIFNTTLVDLEELHTASMVQEKLLDSMETEQQHGPFRFFAANRAMTSFGGDFLTLNPVNERYSGIFIGDVAGSGVASTLVMAFVKACVIQLEDLYLSPCEMLVRIDSLIRNSSTTVRQHKFMSLQYALLDGETGIVKIASAGQCFPLVLSESDGISVLKMPSAPLGAGKSARVSVHDLKLQAGEKLILYTAGLYRNADLGFEKLTEIFTAVGPSGPQEFYKKVVLELDKRPPVSDCRDDQTMIVITLADRHEQSVVEG